MPPSKSDPIAIIGAGAFGLSTALHLLDASYINITVYERDEQIPSQWSAANDLNKIVRAEYEDDFYTELTVEAMKEWQSPLFAPYFHRTGFLHCCSGASPAKALDTLRRFRTAAERHPLIQPYVSDISSTTDIRALPNAWQLQGDMPGWKGYMNYFDGYAHSANTLRGLHRHLSSRGVRFLLGSHITSIVYTASVTGRRATGLQTATGTILPASTIIIAVGAAATTLLPQIGSSVVAKSWAVAHVQLTDDETAALRGIPVTYARDLGFFFEPDPATNLLKICPMGGGYINTNPANGLSQPPTRMSDNYVLPKEDEGRIRTLLRHTLPHLADRPLVKSFVCWFADTDDSDFIVDYVPDTSGSVVLLSGDSGHGFKMMPIAGRWTKELLERGEQDVERWRWRKVKENKEAKDWGSDVSWRLGSTREFKEVKGERAKL